jgi:hypothetical protein
MPSLSGRAPRRVDYRGPQNGSPQGLYPNGFGISHNLMIDRIRDLLKAKDWHPFTIHRSGGNSIHIVSREQAWVSPYSRLVVEIAPGWIEILNPDQTTGVDVTSVTFTEIQNQTG